MNQEKGQKRRLQRGRPEFEVYVDRKPLGALWSTPTPGLYSGFVDVKGRRHRLFLVPAKEKEGDGDHTCDS